ncbi:MAG: alpha-keto acid decarboxylase family protein [Chlorobium sp.]|nr:MAG: alpha-keto acid decarboxylase family protein [Chlorobium sp.]
MNNIMQSPQTAVNSTVSSYLLGRFMELGVRHLFGVPGDYILDFLDDVISSRLAWIGTCNELNAGYAADGYARLNGMGVAVVTYGVGGFSALNAVAGAYAEGVPLVLVSGAPHTKRRSAGEMMHHIVADYDRQFDIFRKVTIDAVQLLDPETAPDMIDRALSSCIRYKLPVYLELPADLAHASCSPPAGMLRIEKPVSDPENLGLCLRDAAGLLNAASNPVILAGIEVLRFGLGDDLLALVEQAEIPFATMMGSKCVLPELHPQFIGIYQGSWSRPEVQKQVESSDCLLSLGLWMTDINTGAFSMNLDVDRMIRVADKTVKIGARCYENIVLKDIIRGIVSLLRTRSYLDTHPSVPFFSIGNYVPDATARLTAASLYKALDDFLDDRKIMMAEPGDSYLAALDFNLQEPENFIVQSHYSSIGFCTPASLGVALARPEKRPVVLTGDGAFQMTMQEVSTLMRWHCPAVLVIVNNEGYLAERMLHQDGIYNDIQMWRYADIPAVFNSGGQGIGLRAETEREFHDALAIAEQNPDKLILIEACIGKMDCSERLRQLGTSLRQG